MKNQWADMTGNHAFPLQRVMIMLIAVLTINAVDGVLPSIWKATVYQLASRRQLKTITLSLIDSSLRETPGRGSTQHKGESRSPSLRRDSGSESQGQLSLDHLYCWLGFS